MKKRSNRKDSTYSQRRKVGGDKIYRVSASFRRNLLKILKISDYIERVGKSQIKTRHKTYIKAFLPREFPSALPMGFLNEFIKTDYPVDISIYLNRYRDEYALALLQRNLTTIRGEKYYYESMGMTNSEKYIRLLREEALADELRAMIVSKQTHLHDITFTVGVRGSNYEELKENAKRVEVLFKANNFKLHRGFYRAWDIFTTLLPITKRAIPYYLPTHLHTDSATAFFPFTSGVFSTIGKNAVLYGLNEINNTPIFIDRFLYPSHNMLVFGQTGSGKSYFSKLTMVRSRIANPDILIYSIDPLGEYGKLVEEMGGLNVKLWNPAEEGAVINPLDKVMGSNTQERVKNFIALLTTIFDVNREEKVFVDSVLYKLYNAMGDEEIVVGDFIEKMEESIETIRRTEGEQPAMRYGGLLNLMQIFESGSLSFLNQPSTINTERYKYVNFDLSDVPEDYIPFFMFFVINYVYSQIKKSEHKELTKLFYVDEVHRVWKFPECAERLSWMARHLRHYRAGMTLMTQSANDGFANEYTFSLMENTMLHLLLHHEQVSDETADFYHLTSEQEGYVVSAHGGKGFGFSTGLLVVGAMRIPLKVLASEEEHRFLITG